MEEYNIREIITYKNYEGIPLTSEEKTTALKYMSEEEINKLYRCMINPKGCYNLNNLLNKQHRSVVVPFKTGST